MPCYYRCPAHSTVATDHFLWLNATDAQNLDEYFLSHASIAGYGQYWAKKDSAEFDSHSVLVGMTQERWDNKPYSYFAQFEMEQRELASLPDIVDYFLKEPDIEVRGEYELVLVCMDLDDVFVWLEDMKEERKAARLREAERKLFGEEIEEEAKEDASCEKSLEIKQETKKENQEGANEEIKEKNDDETKQPVKEETKTSKPSFDWIANTHLVRLLKRCALVTSKLSSLSGDKINGKYYWSKITERRPDFTNGKCILLGMEPHEYANLLDYLGNQMEHTDMNKIKPWFKISEILPKVQYYVHPEGFDITDPDAILVCVEDWDLWRWIKEGVKFIAERGRLEAQIVGRRELD